MVKAEKVYEKMEAKELIERRYNPDLRSRGFLNSERACIKLSQKEYL